MTFFRCPNSLTFPFSMLETGRSQRVRLRHQVFKFSSSQQLTLHFKTTLCIRDCENVSSTYKINPFIKDIIRLCLDSN